MTRHLLCWLGGLMLAALLLAQPAAAATFSLRTGNNTTGAQTMSIDSNQCGTAGPRAAYVGGIVTAGGTAETGVTVSISTPTNGFFLAGGQQAMAELLALPEPPTAVFAAGDQMAIGALHAAAQAGRAVPADVAVVGFDDIDAASLVRPALTTVAQDERALGAAAVAALRRMLERRHEGDGTADGSGAADPGTHVVSTRLVVRESSAPR
jgi:LacI family transcriptional regulator